MVVPMDQTSLERVLFVATPVYGSSACLPKRVDKVGRRGFDIEPLGRPRRPNFELREPRPRTISLDGFDLLERNILHADIQKPRVDDDYSPAGDDYSRVASDEPVGRLQREDELLVVP